MRGRSHQSPRIRFQYLATTARERPYPLTGQSAALYRIPDGGIAAPPSPNARLSVFTCEAVPLIAETVQKIVERNGYADRISVLVKPSQAVQLGPDMPARANLLVHEIFSSELLGEHVLPAIEDAKQRLLEPGAEVLPSAASIMVALVGGDTLGRYLHVGRSFGFELGDFNALHPKNRSL